ncbi:PH domain-containing protein [Nocardiopsis coralliicola]
MRDTTAPRTAPGTAGGGRAGAAPAGTAGPAPARAVSARSAPGSAPPGADSPDGGWLRLSPLTVAASAAVVVLVVAVPAVAGTAVLGFFGLLWPWGALTFLAGTLLAGVLIGDAAVRHRLTRYRVTPDRVEMESGVLARTHRSLRRDRVRSVDAAAPLWARPFGLRKVTVGTGQDAGDGDEAVLELVTADESERLRRTLLQRTSSAGHAAADPGAAEQGGTSAEAPVLASLHKPWLAYGALSPASLAAGYAILLAVLGVAAQVAFEGFTQQAVGAVGSLTARAVPAIAAAVLGALALGVLGALALHTEAWWDYRLTREPDGTLRVRRGLANLSSVSIEEGRMRGVRVHEPLPLRWAGAASVAAIATGLTESSQKAGLVPKRTLTPEMPRERALAVAAEATGGAQIPALAPHPKAALRRRVVRAAFAVLAVAAAGTGAALLPFTSAPATAAGTAAAALLTAAVGGAWARSSYRGLGHGLDRTFLYLRRGGPARSTDALRRDGVIGWSIRRTPFQRRAGLATLGAFVAAGGGVHRTADMAQGRAVAFADAAVPGLLEPFLVSGAGEAE